MSVYFFDELNMVINKVFAEMDYDEGWNFSGVSNSRFDTLNSVYWGQNGTSAPLKKGGGEAKYR